MPVSPKKTVPTTTKPTTTGAVQTNGDDPTRFVLDRIRDVRAIRALKIAIYGLGKRGKTRLACSFPKPLLLIGTEEGTNSVIGIEGVKFVQIYKPDELSVLAEYAPKGGFKSVFLDHGGGLQDLIVKEVGGFAEIPVQGSWGMLKREQWGAVSSQWKKRAKDLLDLTQKFGLNVGIIAHERDFRKEEDGSTESLSVPTIGPGLLPACSNWISGECDYVVNCFIREQAQHYEEDVAGVKVPMVRHTGEFEYCIRVGPHSTYMTGSRVPVGSVTPKVVVDPTYEKIAQIARGEWKN